MSAGTASYLIVGGGVFGVSTAYYLSKTHPEASIVLLDRSNTFPCPLAASHDFNKIVRADYGNAFYCALALEAREVWKSDELYRPFYHQAGLVNLDDAGLGRRIVKNYKDLGVHPGATLIGPDEMKLQYNGIFADANYAGVKEIFVNPSSGWAEATLAVEAVVQASRTNGVQFIQGDVKSLAFDADGSCSGVHTADGRTLHANNVILSTGAGTAKLLAESAPERAELQAEGRITAAAVVTGIVKLSAEQMERFSVSPAFIHSIDGVLGQVLPPTPDGLLKFCVDVSFKNDSCHQQSGQMISSPPDTPDQDQCRVSESLKKECHRVVSGIYGKELQDYKFDSFRICWDGITPNQDFIISGHPHCRNLYIATGGSFHGWKFLPIIGKYVVHLLDGTLKNELRLRWAWNREQKGSAHEKIVPKRELRDLL